MILKTFTIIKLTIVASKAFHQETSLSELYKRTIMSSGFVTEAEVGPNNSNDLKLSLLTLNIKVEEKKKQRQDEWERVRKPEDPVDVRICLLLFIHILIQEDQV